MHHWPGDFDPEVSIGLIHMHPHTGTHIDAPLHYVPGGITIDMMPHEATLGLARVVQVEAPMIEAGVLGAIAPEPGERLLFRTSNSGKCWSRDSFRYDFVSITPDGARVLASAGVRTVGIDYLSIGPYGDEGHETHKILLSAGIWIIEGLNLADVSPGRYELVCLPLKLEGGDGAPARALVRKLMWN